MFGTRNGDILEAGFSLDFTGITLNQKAAQDELENSTSSEEETDKMALLQKKKKNLSDKIKSFSFTYCIYVRSHSAQIQSIRNSNHNRKLFFSLHSALPIMASVGEDYNLMLWDIEKDYLLETKNFGLTPTCVRFSKDGKYIVLGFENVTVMLFVIVFQKPNDR